MYHCLPWSDVAASEAWSRRAAQKGLSTSNCQWTKLMGEFVRSNFQARYKTPQQYDLSKRLWNSLSSAGCLQQWSDVLGEWSDLQCAELNTLSALQNMHSLSKIVFNSLQDSYPAALLSTLFIEGCKLLATCLRSAT